MARSTSSLPVPDSTVNQYAAVRRRHNANLLTHGFHGHTVADNHTAACDLFAEIAILGAQPLRLDRVLDHD